ncbi:MAG: energy-coupling factor transporter transmembrane component T family protein [Limnochordia bacterium]|nr:energy-coupling factor transporter transmembrane protein EcfT [Bacillota bacterium]
MLRDMTLGQYIPGESFVHRLDPRTKIIVTMLLIILLFLVETFQGYGLIALFIGGLILLARLSPRFVLRGIRPMLVIILFTLVLHVFLSEGEIIGQLGPLKVTKEGLFKGGMMVTRLLLLIIGASLLTLTTSPIALTDGIEAILSPGKRFGLPAHELAMMMTIALRFIPTLLEEMDKITKAQMARGADFETGNIVQRAKSLLPLLVPLFVSAFRRADELAVAMEARCYRGGEGRTKMKQLLFTGRDYAVISLTLTFAVIVGSLF